MSSKITISVGGKEYSYFTDKLNSTSTTIKPTETKKTETTKSKSTKKEVVKDDDSKD